jgi:uncharacterized protein (TIGR04255 family)
MGKKLTHAPVYFSIVQVKFNPLFKLDGYVAEIQDRLRRAGYPDAKKGLLTQLNLLTLNQSEHAAPAVPVLQSSRYIFGNRERTAEFILDQFALTFQTTEYDVFESFSERFLVGLDAVQDAASLDYVERVGVRYLNAIQPRDGEELSSYLAPQLTGLSATLGGSLIHSFSETRVKKNGVEILVRSVLQDSTIAFPPDLQPMMLELLPRFRAHNGFYAILDLDGWRERREEFARSYVAEALHDIHDHVENAFLSCTTKHAKEVWA